MGKDRSGRGPKWARTEVGSVRTEVGATFGIRTEVGMDRSGLVPNDSVTSCLWSLLAGLTKCADWSNAPDMYSNCNSIRILQWDNVILVPVAALTTLNPG